MIVKITKLSEKELEKISKNRLLSLSLEEMKAIQNYFKKKKREPTDVELETIAQTWSEHCKHKTFNAEIEYYENGKKYHFKNLFKETIVKVTNELNKKWCVSVFCDNAGIIKFDDKYNIAFKVETHNHPSAIEPYGG
jgi:phosphoribosylformylglycinamidine (FGAM) synthase-like enzyme